MMFSSNKESHQTAKRIPFGSVGVEIGVWRGESSKLFLEQASHLHMVDPWSIEPYRLSPEHGGFNGYLKRYGKMVGESSHGRAATEGRFQAYYDNIYHQVVKDFQGRPVTIHRCTSDDFFASITEPVDWFYIDGSHTHDGCLADLRNSMSWAKYAIFGDDYLTKPGVTTAVNAFVKENGLDLAVFGNNQYMIPLE